MFVIHSFSCFPVWVINILAGNYEFFYLLHLDCTFTSFIRENCFALKFYAFEKSDSRFVVVNRIPTPPVNMDFGVFATPRRTDCLIFQTGTCTLQKVESNSSEVAFFTSAWMSFNLPTAPRSCTFSPGSRGIGFCGDRKIVLFFWKILTQFNKCTFGEIYFVA